MKLLFIYPHIRDGQQRAPDAKRYFPWGLATVMKCLENDGHEVQLLDIYGNDLLPFEVEEYLDHHNFDCACISSFASMNYSYVLFLAEAVKKRRAVPVIVGGLLSDLHYPLLLKKSFIDICVIGEGEETAVDLFRNMDKLQLVKGIAYRQNGQIKLNPPRPLIKNLDTLPMPNFSLWNMERYLKQNLWAEDQTTRYEDWPGSLPPMDQLTPNMALFFGRGCPFRCKFCSRSYQTVRFKSVDKIIEEMLFFKDNYHIKAVHFYDELVVFKKETTYELCKKIEKTGLYWDCQARVNTIDKDILLALKKARCYSIGLGLESGSNRILKAMDKGITREQSLAVLKAAKNVNMHLKLQLMFGYPGETEKDLAATLDLVKKSGYPPRRLSWTTPLPGSEIYDDAIKQGLIKDEEAYIISLNQGMNRPGRILANISGKSDEEASRLYEKVHRKMEYSYFLGVFWKPKNFFNLGFWSDNYRLLESISPFHRGVMRTARKMKQMIIRQSPKK
jgi:anaerobic magnesium-protoporphyrin IX monomethyl ester cyclase